MPASPPVSVAIAAAFAVLLAAAPAPAELHIAWVTIGDPANLPDDTGHGSVPIPFRISRYETTKREYVAFLNAVAADDTYGLYHVAWEVSIGIARTGDAGSYSYTALIGRREDPANFVSFWNAARFANWMHNGQPSGAQGASTTEDGAYTLTPEAIAANSVTRNPGARFFVPSEDEWYKAAYYDPVSGGYFDYPTGTDVQTTCWDIPSPAPNHANCDWFNDWEMPVGSFPGSPSPYGTFDQGGNVFEWNEGIVLDDREIRGGSFLYFDASFLNASTVGDISPEAPLSNLGFRLAATTASSAPAILPALGPLGIAALSSLLGLTGVRASRKVL
jgi:formylglycine-generating enzyme required for sulfatase activity